MCTCSCKPVPGTRTASQRHSAAREDLMRRACAATQHTHQLEASILLHPAAELPQAAKKP
eukprot:4509755-Pleurochrysis_carterae.AAC.1